MPDNFYSHAPRGARQHETWVLNSETYFYSHAPRGARRDPHYRRSPRWHFYSHAPRGARQSSQTLKLTCMLFLLTRPSRGATRLRDGLIDEFDISTHTPLAGRDGKVYSKIQLRTYFYSHAPRGARPLHLAHAATAPVTYWGGPDFSLKYRVHGDPFRAKNRIFSGEPPGISQLQHLRLTVFACILLVDIASVHPLVYVTPSCHAVILL